VFQALEWVKIKLPLTCSLNRGSVAFVNDKFGTIVIEGKIGKSLSHSIDNIYGLKHNLFGVSQVCDKDNLVVFFQNNAWLLISTHEMLC